MPFNRFETRHRRFPLEASQSVPRRSSRKSRRESQSKLVQSTQMCTGSNTVGETGFRSTWAACMDYSASARAFAAAKRCKQVAKYMADRIAASRISILIRNLFRIGGSVCRIDTRLPVQVVDVCARKARAIAFRAECTSPPGLRSSLEFVFDKHAERAGYASAAMIAVAISAHPVRLVIAVHGDRQDE